MAARPCGLHHRRGSIMTLPPRSDPLPPQQRLMERRDWFTALAQLTYPTDPAEALRAFRAYAPLLRSMPDAAFTEASLEHVACAPRRMQMPGFDDVRNGLSAWWRAHRPPSRALPSSGRFSPPPIPERKPPSPEEVAAVSALLSAWRQERAARVEDPASPFRTPLSRRKPTS
ncbi:Hypothetical protein GbCGDNIH3_1590 [Granulibacter bethesdensis]|uniref:Uncharacterized protein n=2 Tax=Granulibacter bethesdensis TaxID=364410 RepID=A0AAN0VG47_9PROT|nr:Hypothetical protein GbCGDNIH3_1590 [Granulibacter bethesdensis]